MLYGLIKTEPQWDDFLNVNYKHNDTGCNKPSVHYVYQFKELS